MDKIGGVREKRGISRVLEDDKQKQAEGELLRWSNVQGRYESEVGRIDGNFCLLGKFLERNKLKVVDENRVFFSLLLKLESRFVIFHNGFY